MKRRYLVTGGTGFLGEHVVKLLKRKADVDVISRSGKTGLQGDLSRWNGGIELEKVQGVKYDALIHLAGLYDLSASESDVYMNNVVGTNVALQIANALKIPVFLNASSIAAAANQENMTVTPDDLDFSKPFHDPYSESKALGEQLLKNWLGPIRLKLNLRLGILVGDSKAGTILRVDGPYNLAKSVQKVKPALKNWKLPLPLPGNKNIKLPFVPVDQAAAAITKLVEWSISSEISGYKSLHLTPQNGVSVKELYESALRHFGLEKISVQLVDKIPMSVLTKIGDLALDLPEEPLRYALNLPVFKAEETEYILGSNWCSNFADYEQTFWSGYEKFVSNR